MLKKILTSRIIIISIILSILVFSCRVFSPAAIPTEPVLEPTPEIPAIEITGESYTFSEAELAAMILNFAQTSSQFSITNPVVKLDNGICLLAAEIEILAADASNPLLSGLSGKVESSFSIYLGENQQISSEVTEMKINSIPVPSFILDQFSALLTSSIESSLQEELQGTVITNITIDNGYVTIMTGNQ